MKYEGKWQGTYYKERIMREDLFLFTFLRMFERHSSSSFRIALFEANQNNPEITRKPIYYFYATGSSLRLKLLFFPFPIHFIC